MAQDYHDALQVLDHIAALIDNKKVELGIKYVAKNDEDLIPEYPAMLMQIGPVQREIHATQMFYVVFHLNFWIFHAEMTVGKAIRSREDIEFATNVRKLLHENRTLDDHIIFGYVTGEFPGETSKVVGGKSSTIVTTRLTWQGENRVPFESS